MGLPPLRFGAALVCAFALLGCAQTGQVGSGSSPSPSSRRATAPEDAATKPASDGGRDAGLPGMRPGAAEASPGSAETTSASRPPAVGRDGLPEEAVSVEEAADWFPYPPLLSFAPLIGGKGREFAIIGTVPEHDPRSGTVLHVFWQRKPAPFDWEREVERGGFHIQIVVHAPGLEPNTQQQDGDKLIEVRGRTAYMYEAYEEGPPAGERRPWRGQGNVDRRDIRWYEVTKDRRTVQWSIDNNPLVDTEQETISIIDRMIEIYP